MWQRQIQPRAFSGTSVKERGGLRVVDDAHVPVPDSSRAFISLYCSHVAHCSSLRSSGAPWSALCISLVALKNSSRP